jgi:hypothetical protein
MGTMDKKIHLLLTNFLGYVYIGCQKNNFASGWGYVDPNDPVVSTQFLALDQKFIPDQPHQG